jgi:hypothetical protein
MESGHVRHASGPRFERFAAAMQETPPPSAQVLPEDGAASAGPPRGRPVDRPAPEPSAAARPTYLRPADAVAPEPALAEDAAPTADDFAPPPMSGAAAGSATVIPRRPVIEEGGRSRAAVPWLGITSWLLLCGALFASLVGWPDQGVLDRVMAIWSGESPSATIARTPGQGDSLPAPQGEAPIQGMPVPLPADGHNGSAPSFAQPQEALPPVELAPPISEAPAGTAGQGPSGPPLPRFKPSVDRVAAKFSNAFFEFGEQLRQQGAFEAAVHMRRQGSNLDPWKTPVSDPS